MSVHFQMRHQSVDIYTSSVIYTENVSVKDLSKNTSTWNNYAIKSNRKLCLKTTWSLVLFYFYFVRLYTFIQLLEDFYNLLHYIYVNITTFTTTKNTFWYHISQKLMALVFAANTRSVMNVTALISWSFSVDSGVLFVVKLKMKWKDAFSYTWV